MRPTVAFEPLQPGPETTINAQIQRRKDAYLVKSDTDGDALDRAEAASLPPTEDQRLFRRARPVQAITGPGLFIDLYDVTNLILKSE